MIRSMSFLFVVAALMLPADAATYHVSKTGNDSHSGSETQPFLTLGKAMAVSQPGDLVLLGPGVYEETLASVRDGTPAQPIVIDGQGAATVHRVILDKTHHHLRGLTVSGFTNSFGTLCWLRRGAHSSVLSNLTVDVDSAVKVTGIGWESPSSTPFGTDAASNCLVVSNRVTGIAGSTAISIFGENNLIAGNMVHDVGQADFVRLWGRNNIIRGNTFTNNFRIEGIGNHIDFIQTFGNNRYGSWGHLIEQNWIVGIEGGQLSQLEGNCVPEIGNWTFRNNIFMDIALQASCTIPDVKYYNNVFYRCNYGNKSHALTFGSRAYTNPDRHHTIGTNYAHGAQIVNNVFLACGDDRLTRGWYSVGAEIENVVADYNYVAKADYSPVATGSLPLGEGTHDNSSWFELNGINGGNPRFQNADAGDFSLLPGSPLIDAGRPDLDIPTDWAGVPRPQGPGPDIGCFEFLSASQGAVLGAPGRPAIIEAGP